MNVLLATDGSKDAEAACALLTRLQWGADDRAVVVTVVPELFFVRGRVDSGPYSWRMDLTDQEIRNAEEEVHRTGKRLRPLFGSVETRIYAGAPAEQIVRAAEEMPADLIVMGRSGRGGLVHWLLGSAARGVLRDASCAVLFGRSDRPFSRIVLGYDGSPGAEAGLWWAAHLPFPDRAHVQVVTVAKPLPTMTAPDLVLSQDCYITLAGLEKERRAAAAGLAREAADRLRQDGICADTQGTVGVASEGIVRAAHESCAGLIVIGAHTAQGWMPDLMEDTVREILHRSDCPVLVARTCHRASGPAGGVPRTGCTRADAPGADVPGTKAPIS